LFSFNTKLTANEASPSVLVSGCADASPLLLQNHETLAMIVFSSINKILPGQQ